MYIYKKKYYLCKNLKKTYIMTKSKKIDNVKKVQKLELTEMKKVEGGAPIFRLTGILDGIPGNTHFYFFKWRIF